MTKKSRSVIALLTGLGVTGGAFQLLPRVTRDSLKASINYRALTVEISRSNNYDEGYESQCLDQAFGSQGNGSATITDSLAAVRCGRDPKNPNHIYAEFSDPKGKPYLLISYQQDRAIVQFFAGKFSETFPVNADQSLRTPDDDVTLGTLADILIRASYKDNLNLKR